LAGSNVNGSNWYGKQQHFLQSHYNEMKNTSSSPTVMEAGKRGIGLLLHTDTAQLGKYSAMHL